MDDSLELAEKLLDGGSVDHVVQALECRLTIGLGVGIAMERHQIDVDQALQFLAFESSNHAVSLREAAQRLVDGRNAESQPVNPRGLVMRRVTRFPRTAAGRTA
jgi:hypothetical protein